MHDHAFSIGLIFPLSMGIAITRYRLFDIELIIRRTLVYSVLTLTLGLVYVGCIVVLQALIARLIGGSELAIVASTPAIAALSDQNPRFRVIPIRRISLGQITVEDMQAASGDLARHDILLCGPSVMIHSLRAQILARGVPSRQIHFEDFTAMAV